VHFGLGGRDVADGLKKAAVVEPIHPGEGCEFDSLDAILAGSAVNHLCLVEAVNGFREGVVIRISDAADRGFDACLDQALGVSNAHILRSPVRMMDEATFADGLRRWFYSASRWVAMWLQRLSIPSCRIAHLKCCRRPSHRLTQHAPVRSSPGRRG
jgi:hypothetical protein